MKMTESFTSYQGEGPMTGRKTFFLRLAICNLSCSWCDTKYSWTGGVTVSRETVIHLLQEAFEKGCNNLCLTGGEPLLQQHDDGVIATLETAKQLGMNVEVETNGTLVPSKELLKLVDNFNISPKLVSTRSPKKVDAINLKLIDNAIWNAGGGKISVAYKFVVDCDNLVESLAEIEEINKVCDIPDSDIWLMPLGTTFDEVVSNTNILMTVKHPYNVSTRQQILFDQK